MMSVDVPDHHPFPRLRGAYSDRHGMSQDKDIYNEDPSGRFTVRSCRVCPAGHVSRLR